MQGTNSGGAYVGFQNLTTNVVEMYVGISYISVDQARVNLQRWECNLCILLLPSEVASQTFDQIYSQANVSTVENGEYNSAASNNGIRNYH
jgi:putative alpha-1,2-mannosidase